MRLPVINDGNRILAGQGEELLSILPRGVSVGKHVNRVDRETRAYSMTEVIKVQFKNGHVVNLELLITEPKPITPDALTIFQASCLMVFDL